MIETSYVMIKPEFANEVCVIEYVKSRLLSVGLTIEAEGYIQYTEKEAKKHYAEHVGKDFYPELEKYITSDKAYGMKVAGDDAIAIIRENVGKTKNPDKGTIRQVVPVMLKRPERVTQNVVHASDKIEAAETELAIFYSLNPEKDLSIFEERNNSTTNNL